MALVPIYQQLRRLAYVLTGPARNLEVYLDANIRPGLLSKVQLGSIFGSLTRELLSTNWVPNDVFEDIVDKFMHTNQGPDLRAQLKGVALHHGISPEDVKAVFDRHEKPTAWSQEVLDSIGKVAYKTIYTTLHNYLKEWLRRPEKREKVKDTGESYEEGVYTDTVTGDPVVLQEHEEIQKRVEEEGWEDSLWPAVENALHNVPEGRKKNLHVYKKILEDIFTVETPKTLEVLAKELNVSVALLHRYIQDLKQILPDVLKKRHPSKSRLEQIQEKSQEIAGIPKPAVYLAGHPDRQESLKAYIKRHENSQWSDQVKKVLSELSEGKSFDGIVRDTGLKIEQARLISSRYFMGDKGHDLYRKWYLEEQKMSKEAAYAGPYLILAAMTSKTLIDTIYGMEEENLKALKPFADALHSKDAATTERLRKNAYDILEKAGLLREDLKEFFQASVNVATFVGAVRKGLENAAKQKEPIKKIEEGGTGASAQDTHITMWENLKKYHLIAATIRFSSDYDNTDVLDKEKNIDVKTVNPNFKWIDYNVEINASRMFGKVERSFEYLYQQKLNAKGGFEGTGRSTLTIDGKPAQDQDELKKMLDTFMEHTLKKEGVLPHTHCSVTYINIKTQKKYKGIHGFALAYQGIAVPDAVHVSRVKSWEDLQVRKRMGPATESTALEDAKASLSKLKLDLAKAKKEGNQGLVAEIETEIRKVEEYIHKETHPLDEIEDIMKEIKILEKPEDVDIPETKDASILTAADQASVSEIRQQMDDQKKKIHDLEQKEKTQEGPEKQKTLEDLSEARSSLEYLHKNLVNLVQKAQREKKNVPPMEKVNLPGKLEKGPGGTYTTTAPGGKHVFPTPGAHLDDLVKLFEKYGLTSKPNPRGYMSPVDLIVLANAFMKVSENFRDDRLKKETANLKGEEKANKEKVIRHDYKDDVAKARTLFKLFPSDIHSRVETFKTRDPEGFAALDKRVDLKWLQHPEGTIQRIEKILVDKAFKPDVEEGKWIGETEPVKGLGMLEERKFKAIEAYLKMELIDFDKIADMLTDRSLTQVNMDTNVVSHFNQSIARDKKALAELEDEIKGILSRAKTAGSGEALPDLKREEYKPIKEIQLSDEDQARYKAALDKIPSIKTRLFEMTSTLKSRSERPAEAIAKGLLSKLEYFADIYSFFTGLLWFKHRPEPAKLAADEAVLAPPDPSWLKLRNKVQQTVGHLSGLPLHSEQAIRKGLDVARTAVREFLSALGHHVEEKIAPVEEEKTATELPYTVFAAEKTQEQARIEALFPADGLHEAQRVINRFKVDEKGWKGQKAKDMHAKASAELHQMLQLVSSLYREGFSEGNIADLAKKWGVPNKEAAVRMRKVKDALAKKALDEFILKWKDLAEGTGKKKERSELGNRPHTEYDKMGKFVESILPDLFKHGPAVDDPIGEYEEPTRRLPTNEEVKRLWNHLLEEKKGKPAETGEYGAMEFYQHRTEHGSGGGGGGSGRSRPKPPKRPDPRATIESYKKYIADDLKKLSADEIVHKALAIYVKRVRDLMKELPDDTFLAPGDVIDAMVSVLKQMGFLITSLKVGPSGEIKIPQMLTKKITEPVPGEFKSVGLPDITVDTYDELEKLFNKIVAIYSKVNEYIAPDHIGVPPGDISQTRKDIKYLPAGFADWADSLRSQAGKNPKTPAEIKDESGKLVPYHPLRKETTPNLEPPKSEPGRKRPEGVPSLSGTPVKKADAPMEHRVAQAFLGMAKEEPLVKIAGDFLVDEKSTIPMNFDLILR